MRMGTVEHSPVVSLDELVRARNREERRLNSNDSNSSNSSGSSRDISSDAVFRARRRRHPSEVLRKKAPSTTMRAFAQDGSFAYTGATADGFSTTNAAGSSAATQGGQRRKRVPPPSALRDYESATSVLEATRRMELARQRSHVSFGKHTIDLEKTFRTAPEGRTKLTLDSPPHSPKRGGRSSSASFMTPAQVIYAASTGGSSYLSTTSSSGSSGSGSSRSKNLSRQATLRAIAKGSSSSASSMASTNGSDDGFTSTGGSSTSSSRGSGLVSTSASATLELIAAKKKAKKNVSFHNNNSSSETECQHDQSSSSTSVSSMLSPIHAACRKGDYLVVKHVLSFYYGNECVNLVNSSCTCGMTPLQVACDNGHVKIAKLLLRRHAQPNKRGSKKRHHSCIAMACIQKNLELLELLLQYGASVDDDALSIAASSGYDDIVRLLVNFRPKRNLTFDIPAQLFQKSSTTQPSSELDASSINKAAALAVMQDHPGMLLILLGDGKAQASRNKVAACALDATIQSDYRLLRALAKFFDAKILLDAKDANACTLLHHAVRNESVKSVMLLVRLGADVHARDSGGITPLYIACARGHSSIVRVLVEAGAKCISMGPNDESPLHIAAQENHLACVEILLEHGRAPVDGLTRDHCTALHLASQRGNTQVAQCLLEHGADVNALTISDETPLLKASRMSQFQTVKLLMSRGATTHKKTSSPPPLAAENRRVGKENQSGIPPSASTDEVELQFDENRNSSNLSFSRATHIEKQPQGGGEDSIFIAKSNTHTSLKKWIRSVLKNDK